MKSRRNIKDKHRRSMDGQPAFDIPMQRFIENIDQERLELFLSSSSDKYTPFIMALHAPDYAQHSFAAICRKFEVSLHELTSIYNDGQRHLGLLAQAAALPAIMTGVADDAKPRQKTCERCDGEGFIWKGKEPKRYKWKCPACNGLKQVTVSGDKHALDLIYESMGLTNKKVPLVAQQFNFNSEGLDARMEGMLKLTQSLTLGERKNGE